MSGAPLAGRYAAVVSDLDGVVYRGAAAVEHAAEALRALEVPVVFATNNASRTADAVAEHLRGLGVEARPEDVATSAQAAAWLLSRDLAPGARVLAVGGEGVAAALAAVGLEPVQPGDAATTTVSAVVQGYGPGVTAADLAEAAYAVEGGARWVATNTDSTLPTERGLAPGNGSLVTAVATAVGHRPHVVAGKPRAPLYELCAARLGVDARAVLAVGDRLETDIAGAVAAGLDSLLVLTGVDDLDAVLDAATDSRPTYVATDLRALHRPVDAGLDGSPSIEELGRAVTAVHDALDRGVPEGEIEGLRQQAWSVLAGATSQ